LSLKTAKLWLFALHYPLLALHKQALSRIDDNNIKVQILSQSFNLMYNYGLPLRRKLLKLIKR